MKVTIEIEEKNGKLNIDIYENGGVYTAKERRIVNLIARAFPKNAVVSFSNVDAKSPFLNVID